MVDGFDLIFNRLTFLFLKIPTTQTHSTRPSMSPSPTFGQTTQAFRRPGVSELANIPELLLGTDSLTSFTYWSRILEEVPLDITLLLDTTVLHYFRNRNMTITTYRRSSLDLSAYAAWMTLAIDVCVGFNPENLPVLSTWTRRGPNGIEPCPLPPKIDTPRIAVGHLFAHDVFGNEHIMPLYYIQVVQGGSDAVKVLISSSKQEVVDSAFAAAYSGYSTVFIGGICQRMHVPSLLSRTQWRSAYDMSRKTVQEAVEMLRGDPTRLAVIY